MNHQLCYLLFLTLFLSGACNSQSDAKLPTGVPQETPSQSSPDDLPAGLFNQDERAAEAWRQFTVGGRYRIAKREDFHIPETVMKEHFNDPFFTNKFAYVGGDFNRDGRLLDRAFIVVDTRTTSKERFGLVVFNAPTVEDNLPSIHWVKKDQDLSKSVLSAATDVLSLTEYDEDGNHEVCNVQWDKKGAEYSCQKRR